jgi:hypothetical protein
VASTASPIVGVVAAALAAVALMIDVGGPIRIGRRLTARRASQNVLSRDDGGRPGTLVLVAHYDAGRTGFAYGAPARLRAALGRWAPGPFQVVLAALLVVLACAAARAGDVESMAPTAVQFVATIVLILAVTAFADIALSSTSPGAGDNASGVATVLRLAERYGDDLEHFDVWVLMTGGEGAMAEGMRAWVRRHRRELDPTATVFLNVDSVGDGTIRYARRSGPLLTTRAHPQLVGLCRQLAEEDSDRDRYGVRPIVQRAVDDARVARRAGFPSMTISCRDEAGRAPRSHRETDTPDRVDDASLERAFAFCSELIELIDERIGPDVAERHAEARAGAASF